MQYNYILCLRVVQHINLVPLTPHSAARRPVVISLAASGVSMGCPAPAPVLGAPPQWPRTAAFVTALRPGTTATTGTTSRSLSSPATSAAEATSSYSSNSSPVLETSGPQPPPPLAPPLRTGILVNCHCRTIIRTQR